MVNYYNVNHVLQKAACVFMKKFAQPNKCIYYYFYCYIIVSKIVIKRIHYEMQQSI